MSEIHEDMESWGRSKSEGEETLRDRFAVEPVAPGVVGVAETLEILSDGEAHTIDTIDDYLQFVGVELTGCQIAACLGRLELDGHAFKMLGPYDIFGSPGRFKLEGGK